MPVSRFSVSLEVELLTALDQYVTENNFSNRSQALRHLIEKNRVEQKWKCDNMVAGAIVMVPCPLVRTSESVPRCNYWRTAIQPE
jgi:CopG family transcriptional regulator, nickel-responsive regulator